MRVFPVTLSIGVAAALAVAVAIPSSAQSTKTTKKSTAKAGARCTTLNQRSGTFVCQRKAGRLVWAAATATPTSSAASTGTAAPTGTPVAGIEGAWKPTSASTLGYRAKEILQGQATEGVGRTNAIAGSMTIAANKVTTVDLTVDMKTLKSDSGRRDGQVQDRILDTAAHPRATLKLLTPIDLGATVPEDKVEVSQKARVELTIRGTTKTVELDLKARRNGTTIEVNGSYNVVFSEWGIPDPSIAAAGIAVDPNALLEFLVVFGR